MTPFESACEQFLKDVPDCLPSSSNPAHVLEGAEYGTGSPNSYPYKGRARVLLLCKVCGEERAYYVDPVQPL